MAIEFSLALSMWGWIGFVSAILLFIAAVVLIIKVLFLKSHGDYDFGTPLFGVISILGSIVLCLFGVILLMWVF